MLQIPATRQEPRMVRDYTDQAGLDLLAHARSREATHRLCIDPKVPGTEPL